MELTINNVTGVLSQTRHGVLNGLQIGESLAGQLLNVRAENGRYSVDKLAYALAQIGETASAAECEAFFAVARAQAGE